MAAEDVGQNEQTFLFSSQLEVSTSVLHKKHFFWVVYDSILAIMAVLVKYLIGLTNFYHHHVSSSFVCVFAHITKYLSSHLIKHIPNIRP